jgi:hypothetical protein
MKRFGVERILDRIQTFITDNKIYCIHIADDETLIREHSMLSNFPINTISEVKAIIDPVPVIF